MKRITDGASYNTATAIKVALHRKQEGHDRQVTHYRTRQGRDFYHVQNFEGSKGHFQDSFEQMPDGYWHETYNSREEVEIDTPRAKVRLGDRRIGRKPNAK